MSDPLRFAKTYRHTHTSSPILSISRHPGPNNIISHARSQTITMVCRCYAHRVQLLWLIIMMMTTCWVVGTCILLARRASLFSLLSMYVICLCVYYAYRVYGTKTNKSYTAATAAVYEKPSHKIISGHNHFMLLIIYNQHHTRAYGELVLAYTIATGEFEWSAREIEERKKINDVHELKDTHSRNKKAYSQNDRLHIEVNKNERERAQWAIEME